MQSTNVEANNLADKAETSKNIDLFMQYHELRKTIKENEIHINSLDLKLLEKISELKKI